MVLCTATRVFMAWGAFKRVIECGCRGDAKATALNPSQARLGRRAENEREGTQAMK
ncbi:MAG: hypothetical protein ABIH24_08300 [Verrucomicrobiota bacterium]